MGDGSTIEWTDATWNPIVGCSRVSAGCEHCYAERVAHRGMSAQHRGLTVMGKHGPRWTGEVREVLTRLDEPLKWKKPRRVFVNSMSDLFHEKLTDDAIDVVFARMQATPMHTYQVLTKRPERAREYLRGDAAERVSAMCERLAAERSWCHAHEDACWPLGNVWLGVSVEDQRTADERIPVLLDTPAALRWVSYEPALGPVDWKNIDSARDEMMLPLAGLTWGLDGRLRRKHARLDWIVVGGESGPGARPFDLAWARSTIAQCRAAGVPVFVKQLGAMPRWADAPPPSQWSERIVDRKGGDPSEWPEDLRVRELPGEPDAR